MKPKKLNEAQLEQLLQDQVAQLPSQLTPSRDLWAGIDRAIEQQQQQQQQQQSQPHQQGHSHSGWHTWSAVAAGFGLVALMMWASVDVTGPSYSSQPPLYVSALSESFEQQKQLLLANYQGQKPYTDNWQAQLKQLDEAAVAIKQALIADPANGQLMKMLQQTYQQQLDLIKAVNHHPWRSI